MVVSLLWGLREDGKLMLLVGCWGPCYTMSSHAALGVVRAGVASLKGTGIRINCISPGQIDIGVDLKNVSYPQFYEQLLLIVTSSI